MPPVVCVSVAAENITNSVITRDDFPIIFFPKHFLCWKCYENLRNYGKNTIFKNEFLLSLLNIKVMYVYHRKNKKAKRGNENHQIQHTERSTITVYVCVSFQFFLCTEKYIFKWHPSTTSYFINAFHVFILCH